MRRFSLIGILTFLGLFVYFYKTSGNFRKSIMSALVAAFILASGPLESEAKGTDAFTTQQQTTRIERNRSLFSRGARKPNNNGQGKPNGSDGSGDDDKDMSQYPKVESVQETESRLDDIDKSIARMEESSDSEEEECEAREQFQVDESYKSNSALKKITEKAQQNVGVMNDVENVKQMLTEGTDPMKIGYKTTKLGNDFYYIRKSVARIVVKLDRTTGNSDIVAVAPRSNNKTMKKFAKTVNSEFDTKRKINSKAY